MFDVRVTSENVARGNRDIIVECKLMLDIWLLNQGSHDGRRFWRKVNNEKTFFDWD